MGSELLHVEFHCHTNFSGDSLLKPARLVETARKRGIDRVVITDHNTIEGALKARSIDPEMIIVGEEILTTKGEILAFFVKEHVPSGLIPQETIGRLRDQGAFVSVSHPFDEKRGWTESDLFDILPIVDAIETFNSRCLRAEYNVKALAYAKQHKIPGTVGSDAHTAWEIGRSYMKLEPFADSDGLRRVIGRAYSRMRLSSPHWIRLSSRLTEIVKKKERRFFRLVTALKR